MLSITIFFVSAVTMKGLESQHQSPSRNTQSGNIVFRKRQTVDFPTPIVPPIIYNFFDCFPFIIKTFARTVINTAWANPLSFNISYGRGEVNYRSFAVFGARYRKKTARAAFFRLIFQVGTNESYLLSSSFRILSERVRIWKEYFALLFLRMAL